VVSIVDAGIEPTASRRHVAAAEVFAVLRESTDLEAARAELAHVVGKLRLPTLAAEPVESTPEAPEAEASGWKEPTPRRDRAISATFWLADDSGPPLRSGITAADGSPSGTPALGDQVTTRVRSLSSRSDPPVTLSTKPARRSRPVLRTGARIAAAATVAAVALALLTTAIRSARRTQRVAMGQAAQGPRAAVATSYPVTTGAPAETSAPPSATPGTLASPSEAPCSGPGWVVVPPSRAGHRVWIDGRLVGGSPGRFPVPGGSHVVRVGSHGLARTVLVGCAEEQLAR
jgi:hypothetical protein